MLDPKCGGAVPDFQRIEVLFGDPNKPDGRKVIVQRGQGVEAIFLEKGAVDARKKFKMAERGKKAQGISFLNSENGPIDVCYLVNGELFCWDRS
jgi:hypothetical protein